MYNVSVDVQRDAVVDNIDNSFDDTCDDGVGNICFFDDFRYYMRYNSVGKFGDNKENYVYVKLLYERDWSFKIGITRHLHWKLQVFGGFLNGQTTDRTLAYKTNYRVWGHDHSRNMTL